MTMPGIEKLVSLLDDAVAQPDVEVTTDRIKSGLCRLLRSGDVRLPAELSRPLDGHYARRLVYSSPQHGYSVVAMTWAPGQATPVHDHSGMWCVEGVCDGSLEVQQYELIERDGDRYRFEKRNSYQAGFGSAGCLIPPYEYHRIANACSDEKAVSIHIYGGDMTCCNVFERAEGDWYTCSRKPLSLDG
ncbi:MAG TPA: cysteine dioxygenase family protein [Gammaproteobacteria bacterium]|nr:cysteine dioxygenase family protein [Gammaproteobacteria bacterium]